MPSIRAFKGTFYDTTKAGDPSLLIAPCLSEVNSLTRAALAARSRHNIIRVLRPNRNQDGTYDYASSAALMERMEHDGFLRTDMEPAIYKYMLSYKDADGTSKSRTGLYCLIESDSNTNGVLPHERTFPDAVRGWAMLSTITQSDLSAVFGLFEDHGGEVQCCLDKARTSEVVSFKDESGQAHTLSRIDPASASDLIRLMERRTVVIADGHHRYEAARQSSDPRRLFTLSCLFTLDSEGIQIRPFHRHMKGIAPELLSGFASKLGQSFSIKQLSGLDSLMEALKSKLPGSSCFGAYSKDFGFLEICQVEKQEICSAEVLHEHVLPNILEFGRMPFIKDDGQGKIVRARVNFSPAAESCVQAVNDGFSQAAFFTVPPTAVQIMRAAKNGKPLPEKSTCFQPKPIEGLIFRKYSNHINI